MISKKFSSSLLHFHFFFVSTTVYLLLIFSNPTTTAAHLNDQTDVPTTIVFATLGSRSTYAFDIYSLPITSSGRLATHADELRLTDGRSINYNGHFAASSSSSSSLPLTLLPNQTHHVIYVTERNGSSKIYLNAGYYSSRGDRTVKSRSVLDNTNTASESTQAQEVCLVGCRPSNDWQVSMKDRPSLAGEYLVYVSTHENAGAPRTSWAAVYSTHLTTGLTRRLTPYGVADYSPALSPSGVLTAVASYGERGWDGEVEELSTDIYVFLTRDGSNRLKVVEHGGWPTWVDESTFYFHRRGGGGWWSVYRAVLPENGIISVDSVATHRITPPGLHSFTPAASVADKSFIAVATRRPGSEFRHIELFDVVSGKFTAVTLGVSPQAHHLNPFISSDSTRIGYHRCRGNSPGLFLEKMDNPRPGITLLRVDGSFPSFSPDGSRIAYVNFPGAYVVNSDGSGRRRVLSRTAFSTAWDPIRRGVVYTSIGPTFASESTSVDVISINVDDDGVDTYKKLTTGGENNAFPSPSPDGKWVVFRSGRTGHKNLYIMDAVDGEKGGLYRLTKGPWSDTMPNWSPNGDWIAFASDRENSGSGSFALFMIHPNGTGLQKVLESGSGGRVNHPCFSPDGNEIVFTSDYAAVSAEPISNPHHFQPYGEIYTMRTDGSNLQRLTHNSFEDGTPTWGPKFMKLADVKWPTGGPTCAFEDCHWLSTSPKSNYVIGDSYISSVKAQCGLSSSGTERPACVHAM